MFEKIIVMIHILLLWFFIIYFLYWKYIKVDLLLTTYFLLVSFY